MRAQVKVQLRGVPELPEWRRASPAGASLPSFSAYPLAYVTAIGEYLMTMPQQVRECGGGAEGRMWTLKKKSVMTMPQQVRVCGGGPEGLM